MKNKKILIIVGIVVGLIIIGVLLFFLLQNNKTYTVTFDSDGGTEVEKIEVKKGDIIVLPKVTKNGYNFVGWFDNNTKVTTNLKVTKDITLKAKWISEDAKTFTVTFNSDGGSSVEELIVECGKELKLPKNPTKEGYEFVSWVDKNETPILDGALLSCENITLKANWKKVEDTKEEKKEEKKEETKKQEQNQEDKLTGQVKPKTYSCPQGYELVDGNKCQTKVSVTESCKEGYTYSPKQGICYGDQVPLNRKCKQETINGASVNGELIHVRGTTYSCGYSVIERFNNNERSCENSGYYYSSDTDKCYARLVENNVNVIYDCPSGYYHASAYIFDDSQSSELCVHTAVRIRTCPDGYSQDGNVCYKTINATEN